MTYWVDERALQQDILKRNGICSTICPYGLFAHVQLGRWAMRPGLAVPCWIAITAFLARLQSAMCSTMTHYVPCEAQNRSDSLKSVLHYSSNFPMVQPISRFLPKNSPSLAFGPANCSSVSQKEHYRSCLVHRNLLRLSDHALNKPRPPIRAIIPEESPRIPERFSPAARGRLPHTLGSHPAMPDPIPLVFLKPCPRARAARKGVPA